MKTRKYTLRLIYTIVIVNACIGCNSLDMKVSYRNRLPSTATEISEKYVDAFPDFSYYLKARISQNEFNDFVKHMGLEINLFKQIPEIERYDSTKYRNDPEMDNYMKQFKDMNWWDLDIDNKVYYKGSEGSDYYASYNNGFLYFFVYKY